MEDRQIIQLLFARAERALQLLAQQFGSRLLSTARHILGNHQDAEECVNDTYLAVWDAIPPKEPDPLGGFVYKTGRNIALNRLRHLSAQKRCGDYDVTLEELAGCLGEDSLEQTVTARALGESIDRFLSTLPRDSRILFLRRYWFGDSVKEVAAYLGYSENLVSVRLNRIRGQLRIHLNKEEFLNDR